MSKTFYITTPIYYVNDVPHIGHAYTTVAADVLARHHSQWNHDVFFLTGLDEHGQKVQQAAAKAGIAPQDHCDRLAPQFKKLWQRLNISNDAFIRTTDVAHKKIVQRYLQQLFDKQLIYKADYTGWYCTFDERFWTEKDVVQGQCPDCKRPIEQISESNYFFRMGQYQERLIRHIESHQNFVQPQSRHNEVLGFLKKPLEDLSISRPKSRLSWGVELPFDSAYVTYVWFDALVNYISALEYLTETPSMERYWPASVHLVGKDILTTHAVYWSTMLMALELPLPQTIFAHGWWTVNGEKMSKSRGNVVDPYLTADRYGVDQFRYFLLREVPFGQDGDYSEQAVVTRIHSELADGLGNLLSRSLTMLERFTKGTIPQPIESARGLAEKELAQRSGELTALAKDHVEHFRFSRALESLWELIQLCDQYIDKNAPWSLAKKPENQDRLNTVLYTVTHTIAWLIPFLYPFMPQTVESMATQLGLRPKMTGRKLVYDQLIPGTTIAKGPSLFPKLLCATMSAESTLTATATVIMGGNKVTDPSSPSPSAATSPAVVPAQPMLADQITIDEFMKIQLKTATVLTAERVPKSEKLLKLQVDLGSEQRQIVAGIGKRYEPEQLIGKRIVIVANLKPAKLMGIESQGMVLAAGDKDVGGLVTVLEEVPPGTKVK